MTQSFEFGANWRRFLATVDESRIDAAARSLEGMLGRGTLAGRRFLDAGCGSGLFSLAAVRLGATVVSFDADLRSVGCTREIHRRFAPPDAPWTIREGSLLDPDFLDQLGEFDVVYCWGVAHHTGAMWEALDKLRHRVAPGGRLWLALYNDQGRPSRCWWHVKRLYNRLPRPLRIPWVLLVGFVWGLLWKTLLARGLGGLGERLLRVLNPGAAPSSAAAELPHNADPSKPPLPGPSQRGMHWWYDLVDWVGGWPFEVARPEGTLRFFRDRGFTLAEMVTCGGKLGCNEYLFVRNAGTTSERPPE